MKKYIALLRGINVGGKNKISMKELKEMFEENGFSRVVTYINSGNIIFVSEQNDIAFLKKKCENMIAERFKLSIAIMIISADDMVEALKNAPDWWDADPQSKHNAIFVLPPAKSEDMMKDVGDIKPEYEKIGYYGSVIFWSAPLETFSHTRWSKVVGSSVYDSITIRNVNTAKKLAELCKIN